jgi:uncharacterized protein
MRSLGFEQVALDKLEHVHSRFELMSPPNITLLLAGLCALVQVVLTALVIVRRTKTGIGLLDGGDTILLRRIRAHGNFSETAPLALLLLALLEIAGLPVIAVWALGAGLVTGRLLHATGLLAGGAHWARLCGMVLTLTVLVAEAALCLWMFAR